MTFRSFVVLLVLTLIASGAAAAAVWQRQKSIEVPAAPSTLFDGLTSKINEVAALNIVTPSTAFTIKKDEDGKWSVPEKQGYPVDFETVKQAVVGMVNMRPVAAQTDRPEKYHKLNLDDPSKEGSGKTITLLDKSGQQLASLVIGRTKSASTDTRLGWFFVRRADQQRSWLAEGRLDTWDNMVRWLDPSMPTVDRPRIHKVISRKDIQTSVTALRTEPDEANFKLESVPEGRKVKYDTAPNALGSAMGFLSFDDVKRKSEIKDWSQGHNTTYRTFDGLVVEIRLATADDKTNDTWANFTFSTDFAGIKDLKIPENQRKRLKSEEEVRKEAETFQAKFGDWAYKLPEYKAKDFVTGMEQMTVPEEAEKSSE